MNPLYLLLLLPALPVMAWAIYTKIKEHYYVEAVTICVPAVAVFVSAYNLYLRTIGEANLNMHWLQMLLGATIVPLAYLYFSRQIGRKINNGTNIVLWLLLLVLFVPNAVIFLPGEQMTLHNSQVRPLAIEGIRDNEVIFSILTGDFVMMAQALLTMLRMIPTVRTLKRYGLKFDHRMYGFGIWWLMAIVYILTISLSSLESLMTTAGSIFYFGGMSLLAIAIYTLIALHFDLHPIRTAEGELVSGMDNFIKEQSSMGYKIKHIVEHDKVYLQAGYTTEDILTALSTNRTYFTRMMQEHFGKTFSQYLNEHRIEHAKQLLLTTDLNLTDIAIQSGFSDATYMGRIFKNTCNLTPKQWQKENKTEMA